MNCPPQPHFHFRPGCSTGRTLYLIDIENMVGSSGITTSDVVVAQKRIFDAAPAAALDHTVIAASHHNGESLLFGWNGPAERKLRSGQDGGDLALLESVADVHWVRERYGRVVIASGDGIFAPAVAALKAAGVEVLVIKPDLGISRSLKLAAGPSSRPLGAKTPRNVIDILSTTKVAA